MKPHWYIVLLCLLAVGYGAINLQTASAANPGIISFQGKVVNADGTNVTNGSYNFDFVMYDDVTLGTPSDGVHDKWHELTKSVTVTNGVFQTNLGSATALPDFNANPSLYLAVRFNADAAGYMTPRVQMASVPYALNADKVGGVAASSIVQLGATQSGNINISSGTITSGLINGQTISSSANFTGTLTVAGASALTLGTASTNDGALIFKSSGGANTVTLQAPTTNPTSSFALKLPTVEPGLSQCLQNDGTTIGQLTFASCSAGGGDNITVNSSAATDANFLNTTASASVAGTTFAVNTASNPDDITLTIGDASGTLSGVITANAQFIGGLKTFNGGVTLAAGQSLTLTSGVGTYAQTSTATTGDIHTIIASSFAPAAAATGNGQTVTVGQASAATSGNSVVNGYNTALILNTTGATGTKDLTAFNANAATLTGCTGGACTVNGLKVVTQSTGALGTITQNGVNVQAVGVSAGVLNGINISGITAGGGTETAINIGAGWDTIFGGTTAATNLFNFTNLTVTSAGVISGITGITMASGNITTSGTIGTAGSTTFTGAGATFTGATNLGTVGTGTAASTIHVADTSDATGTQLVTVGSTAKTTNITTIQGGGAASSIVLQAGASGGIDIGVNNVASKTVNIGSVGTTAQTTTVSIATSTGAAQTLTIGSTSTTSTTTIQSGSGNINLAPAAGSDVMFNQGAGSNFQIAASAVPTLDQLSITNAGQGVTTAGVNGLAINFVGGAAAVEASGARIDLTPGGTTGGTWSGMRIVANGTGPVTGVTEYGIKIEGPTSAGAGTETGMYIGTGWDTGLDVQSGGINLLAMNNPATPAADNLRVYAKKVAGRTMLKGLGSSGVDYPYQPSLFQNNIVFYGPGNGSTVGTGFGTSWTTGGTVTHPTPANTNVVTQMHRTRFANVVTTQNQTLGLKPAAADNDMFWRGNAAGLGGFFFYSRFCTELWPANTVRLFVGLQSGIAATIATDTLAGDLIGLWHDTTDGANVLNIETRNGTTATKTPIAGTTLAAGQCYDFFLYAKPNDAAGVIFYRLDDLNAGTTLADTSTSTNIPRNTIFMMPQVTMSNGTANTTVNTVGISIARIYGESDN